MIIIIYPFVYNFVSAKRSKVTILIMYFDPIDVFYNESSRRLRVTSAYLIVSGLSPGEYSQKDHSVKPYIHNVHPFIYSYVNAKCLKVAN